MSEKEQKDSILQTMRQKVQETPFVLIGIGKEWTKQPPEIRKKAYANLANLVEKKNYLLMMRFTKRDFRQIASPHRLAASIGISAACRAAKNCGRNQNVRRMDAAPIAERRSQ